MTPDDTQTPRTVAGNGDTHDPIAAPVSGTIRVAEGTIAAAHGTIAAQAPGTDAAAGPPDEDES